MDKNRLNALSLSKLHTFEAAARHESFSMAAHELCLTPSAVSHQMSKLEQELALTLFEKRHKKVLLTNDGRQLYHAFSQSLNQLDRQVNELRRGDVTGPLTIYVRPSFASGWLLPRLNDFLERYSSIELKLLTGNENLNLTRHGVDLAIYYQRLLPSYPFCIALFEERIIPVCSKKYRDKLQLTPGSKHLSHCTLLHDNQAWHHQTGTDEWLSWCQEHEQFRLAECRTIGFDRSDLAVQAAVNHMGIAMGRWHLIQEQVAQNQLVLPFVSEPILTGNRYYLLSEHRQLTTNQQCFVDWIKTQLGDNKPK